MLACASFGLAVIFVVLLGLNEQNWFWLLAAVLTVYRLINLLKIIANISSENYLLVSARRASAILNIHQIPVILLALYPPSINLVLPVLMSALGVAGLLLAETIKNVVKLKRMPLNQRSASDFLPTITIAIPARNETDDLFECLTSVMASDYPKLEVIVLDDCSQDNTAEIIRSFAQSGVRFVPGEEPNNNWLAKNHAYEKLADEALGEYILFCGADVRFGVSTISKIVSRLANKDMISILPLNSSHDPVMSLVQPMHYWWELALPRKLVNRPPVLSSAWIIKTRSLRELGTFEAVSRSVRPEVYFAKQLIPSNKYAFAISDKDLALESSKSSRQQLSQALRLSYPRLHQRLEMVSILTLEELILFVAPFALLTLSLIWGELTMIVLAALVCLALLATHGLIVASTTKKTSLAGFLTFIPSVIMELVTANISMLRYEFGTVTWKDRNICIPVMRTVSNRPL